MANLYKATDIHTRFIVIGKNYYSSNNKNIEYISVYSKKNLGKILTDNNVHIVIYPSINNETFSYVAQELITLNVPLIVFNNGAPQERIKKYNYKLGKISQNVSAEGLFIASKKLLCEVYSVKL